MGREGQVVSSARNAVLAEVGHRLAQFGLSTDVSQAVLGIVQGGLDSGEERGRPADGHFRILVARTYCKTALKASAALGSSSLSMLVMLFDLYIAAEEGRPISVTSLCIASGAASTTALRQIGQMEARGFVTRTQDAQDRRRCWVHPTPRALDLIHSLVTDWTGVLRP